MGTGSRTSLPMVVADEMDADWARVKIVQAPGDEPKYGNQDTDGSRSMRHYIQPMRQIGASVRLMLEQAAAKKWNVSVDQVEAKNHEVINKADGKKLGYGELGQMAMDLPTPPADQVKWKNPADFRYIGKGNISIYDLHDITTGKAIYAQDKLLPGTKFAVVARPSVVGGKVKSFDAAEAMKVAGVVKIVEIPGSPPSSKFAPLGGIAVIATNTYAAIKGREALKIDWDGGPNASYDSEAYHKEMSAVAQQSGKVVRNEGDADKAIADAAKVFTAEYYQPHMIHTPMEPPAALVTVKDGKCEAWACVQSPYGTREDLAKLLSIPIENVTVNVTLLGGGFGRKSKCDFVQEAALLSKAMDGAPVKVIWTREDDIQNGFYHTTSVERIEAAIDKSGKVTGWRHRSVAPTILSTFKPDQVYQFPIELGMGFVDMPFEIANVRCENGPIPAHTRIGWFRSVSNIPRAFAIQSFACELAHELGKDPRDMLLELLGTPRKIDLKEAGIVDPLWNYGDPYSVYPIDTGRLRKVVELATERAEWGKKLPPRSGQGLAVHRSFLTYVATVVEVQVGKDGTVRVPRVDTAIDCGFAANPERIRSQVEGGAVMGMTLAMNSEITYKNGQVQQHNFDDYKMIRIDGSPVQTNVHIVANPFEVAAAGVGEPPLPPFAPALCNAIFAATGKRIRNLPIKNTDLKEV